METTIVGKKHDSGKLRWSLLPSGALPDVLKVLEFGAKKYGDMNWQLLSNPKERFYNAAMRHLDAWYNDNEDTDPETGISHLAHAICSLLFLLWFSNKK